MSREETPGRGLPGQIRLLARIAMCNLFGLNEMRYTKDAKKKTRYRLMGILWCVLLLMLVGYVGAQSVGLVYLGLGYLVPAVLAMCVALLVFFFTVCKAGPVLFEKGVFEKQITLPVTVRAILVSRFLSMYVTDMLLGMLVMLPGMAVYGVMERPGLSFYLYGIAGSLFLPLLPLTAAAVAGALITGISSRWRRKNLAAIVLTMILICVIMAGSFGMSGMEAGELEEILQQMAPLLEGRIRSFYPPALWLSQAMVQGNGGMLALFLVLSIGCFLAFLELLRPFYGRICRLLGTNEAKGNYRMKGLQVKSVRRSMVERELRRYFSSVVYVTNTLVGEVMMVLLAAALLVMGKEAVEEMLGMSGILDTILPVALGCLAAMMPISACSISMEGKQWWMMQTLPVSGRDILRAKVWTNVLVAAPFYVVSVLLAAIALRPDAAGLCGLAALPAVYIVFGAEAGVVINRRFPVFDWENETRVVKQSVSTLLAMLTSMAAGAAPLAVLLICREIPAYAVEAVWGGVLLAGILVLDRMGDKLMAAE